SILSNLSIYSLHLKTDHSQWKYRHLFRITLYRPQPLELTFLHFPGKTTSRLHQNTLRIKANYPLYHLPLLRYSTRFHNPNPPAIKSSLPPLILSLLPRLQKKILPYKQQGRVKESRKESFYKTNFESFRTSSSMLFTHQTYYNILKR